jgi:hypothetical protein
MAFGALKIIGKEEEFYMDCIKPHRIRSINSTVYRVA